MRVYLHAKFGGGTVFRTLWFYTRAPKWFQQIISASHVCRSDVTFRLKSTIVIFKMISLPFSLILLSCLFFTWFSYIGSLLYLLAAEILDSYIVRTKCFTNTTRFLCFFNDMLSYFKASCGICKYGITTNLASLALFLIHLIDRMRLIGIVWKSLLCQNLQYSQN